MTTLKNPTYIKRKLNLRKKLLKRLKLTKDNLLKSRINNLTKEIKMHCSTQKRNKVRKKIIPGNSKTLWRAVKNAKVFNTDELPKWSPNK